MHIDYKALMMSDPKFLFYFIPIKIMEGKIFPVTVFSLEKNRLELESFQNRTDDTFQNLFLCFENRFWLYGSTAGFVGQEFSLCFQALDKPNKTMLYSKRKKKLLGRSSFFSKLNISKRLMKETKEKFLVKSRLLRLTKGGFMSSCIDSPAVVVRSSSFYKFRKHMSYRGWFSLNLSYYGVLSYFSLIHFDKKVAAFSNINILQEKNLFFYFLRNKIIKNFLVLGKSKTHLLVNKKFPAND